MPPSPFQQIHQLLEDSARVERIKQKYGVELQSAGKGSAQDDAVTFEETSEGGGWFAQTVHIPDEWMKIAGASDAQEFADWLNNQ